MKSIKRIHLIKATLLIASSMTVMAGATISPSLPKMNEVFSNIENAEFLTKLILTIPAIFIAILAPVTGLITDTFGRKKLLVFSVVLYAISGTSGYFLNNIYLILTSRALLGVAVAGIMTTTTTLIADYFEGKQRQKFMGHQGAFMSFGGVVFISIGGILADISWRCPFLIYALALALLVLVIIFIYEPADYRKQDVKITQKELLKKINLGQVLLIYIVAFLGFVFFFMIIVQMPFVFESLGNISQTKTGISISISMLVSSIVALNYSRIKNMCSFKSVYGLTFLFMGSGFLIIGMAESYAGYMTGLIIEGFGMGMLMPNSNFWIVSIAPLNIRGRLVGNLSMAVYLGQFLSPIVFRPVNKLLSMNTAFTLSGLFMILMMSAFFYSQMMGKKTNK